MMCVLVFLAAIASDRSPATGGNLTRPLLKDFLGVCGHTISFRPKLYHPAVRLVRDYHPFDWDVGDSASNATTFPEARNRVDWNAVYGSWKQEGFDIDVSVMFDNFK